MVITIPYPSHSNNQIKRMHWAKYRRVREELARIMSLQAGSVEPPKKARVVLTRYGPRLLDKDNLYGGAKPMIDALQDAGLILDDSPAHLELECRQEKCKRAEARTEVDIT